MPLRNKGSNPTMSAHSRPRSHSFNLVLEAALRDLGVPAERAGALVVELKQVLEELGLNQAVRVE